MAIPTYKDLLQRIKSRKTIPVKPEQLGFTRPVVNTIGNLPLEGFSAEAAKILNNTYKTNPEFKAMVDLDRTKRSDNTLRQIYHALEVMAPVITSDDTRKALSVNTSDVAEKILSALEKSLVAEQAAPQETGFAKKTGPLNAEELKLFGIDKGKIPPSTTKDDYYEAIKNFNNSEAAGRMPKAERSNYIERFEEAYNAAVKVRGNLLDPADLGFFKYKDKTLESLNQIRPEITQTVAFEIAQSLHKKRLDSSIKKDLLTKLFNTIRDKKIKAHGGLNQYEEQWLDKDKLDKYFEAEVRPKSRVEFQKGVEPMTEEERKEFKKEDELKQHIKPEEFQRSFEVIRGAMLKVTRLKEALVKIDWQKEVDRLAKSLKSSIPPVEEMQDYIEDIEKTLEGMEIAPSDLPIILNVEDGVYKPRLDNVTLKGILDREKTLKESLKTEVSPEEKTKITKAISQNSSLGARLLRLRKMNLKGIKLTVDRYLAYIGAKKNELIKFQKDTVEARKNVGMIENSIKEIDNYFTDLMRLEQFRVRWDRPSAVLPEEQEKAQELGKGFSEAESEAQARAKGTPPKEEPVVQKLAMNAEKYQKTYNKFMDAADAITSLKDEIAETIGTLELKLKSIIEKGPEFKDNPYGGKGPSLKDMKSTLDELVKKLDKYDITKEIDKVKELFVNLDTPKLYVELPKAEKEATCMFGMASRLREAAEKMTAPSNETLMYDIAFPKKRQTPLGPRAFPGFLNQDTNRLAEKFVEYLEKAGLPDMINNPDADVSKQIDEALRKSLKIPGKIEDFLANETRRRFLTDRDLKKAREDLVEIEKLMAGKKDESGKVVETGLRDKLQIIKDKRIKPIEDTLEFVLEPLEKLKTAISGDKPKQEAARALEEMPKEVEKEVRKMPTDVTDSKWYKALQRDKSHNKTKWIEDILKESTEPIDSSEKFKAGLNILKTNIVSVLNEKNQQVSKVTKIPTARIKTQFDQQIAAVNDLIQNKNPNAGVIPLVNFRANVITPLNDLLKAKYILGTMQETNQAFIDKYYKLHDFYSEEIRSKPDKAVELEKDQEEVLNKIKANINYFDAEIEKAKRTIDASLATIYPHVADFLKTLSDLIKSGYASMREYGNIMTPKLTDLRQIIQAVKDIQEEYRKTLEHDKEVMAVVQEQIVPPKGKKPEFKKEAAPDPYGEQLSPYERALEERPGKEDLIVKDKPELYKKIEKTINYFKKVLKEGPSDSFKYFGDISKDIPYYVKAIREEIIPGLKALLQQKVEIPGGTQNIITTLEDAVPTLDNMMQEYSSERLKIKNRLDDEARKYKDTLNKIRGLEEFIDPKTGDFIDFTDKEKEMLKRLFLRQLYKSTDELWSQIAAQMMPTLGPRNTEYYNNVWRAFKDYSGVKSNRRLMSLMNLVKADVRADNIDAENVKRIYLKSQQLEDRKKELEKGMRDLGLDPSKNADVKELDTLIASMKQKEKVVDKVFDEMLKGAELHYISKIRADLRDKMKPYAKDKEEQGLIQETPDKEEKGVRKIVSDVDSMLDKTESSKFVPAFKDSVEKTVQRAENLIASLEKELEKGEWTIDSSSYRKNSSFNPKLLYGSTMRATIKDLLKWELQI